MGTFTLDLTDGTHTFNTGWRFRNYTISSELLIVQSFEDSEIISVFDVPNPDVSYNEDLSILSVDLENIYLISFLMMKLLKELINLLILLLSQELITLSL